MRLGDVGRKQAAASRERSSGSRHWLMGVGKTCRYAYSRMYLLSMLGVYGDVTIDIAHPCAVNKLHLQAHPPPSPEQASCHYLPN